MYIVIHGYDIKNLIYKIIYVGNVKEWRLTFIQMNFEIPDDLTTWTFNRFPILGFQPLSLNRLGPWQDTPLAHAPLDGET